MAEKVFIGVVDPFMPFCSDLEVEPVFSADYVDRNVGFGGVVVGEGGFRKLNNGWRGW